MFTILAIGTGIAVLVVIIGAVPPEACSANFRWEDCGKPPVPVMYYWKPGSRCEVGMWRGCLPNINMFKNEYECVSTCIFRVKAEPANFHQQNVIEEIPNFTDETTRNIDISSVWDSNPDMKTTGTTNEDQGDGDTTDTVSEASNEDNLKNDSNTSEQPSNIESTKSSNDNSDTKNNGANDSTNAGDDVKTGDGTTPGSGNNAVDDTNTGGDNNAGDDTKAGGDTNAGGDANAD